MVQDGYQFFAGRQLVTLFSAPHYCGLMDNSAAVMAISRELRCSFHVFKSVERNIKIKTCKWDTGQCA